ncbi:MAG: hypothetical protein A2622_07390 [Bdellovibrionales bacterium RIFCSPHIGHO2_01_FULL_40_29]|nr:MAG: hypothetical protein A2622_07390 [Bdellovibrionales bacterium RIFCSPHIGHO2_01_FULL_40_29]OFZ34253.1 MAG: hypothetical protein A3D17_04260 [Bdellovibrionales bacterium RIFCSPHIGHO2_02_FULL_40_15]
MKKKRGIENLLIDWKLKRASRVTYVLAKYGVIFSAFSTVIDLYFQVSPLVLTGDGALLMGTGLALNKSRQEKPIWWLWIPLYAALWYAITTSLLETGGIHSPFIGSYFSLLFVSGLVLQVQVRPLIMVLFVFLNLVFWFMADSWSLSSFGSEPPVLFSFLINTLVMAALMVCISEFLKTERTLAKEILNRYRDLEVARKNLNREETANATKSTFLANISHELRTPLGAILGYADLTLDSSTPDTEKSDYIKTIRNNGAQLLHLVNDLLDLTKVEAGKIELEEVVFNPLLVIQEVVDLLTLDAQKKGLPIYLHLEKQLPSLICTDPTRLRQIITNVLGNAVKFSEVGSIDVRVNCSERKNTNDILMTIEVQDSGPGLSATEKSRLFKPFSQADASVTRKFGGTGLGLNLSRQLARLLGGDLYLAWSQPGVGSRFVFNLPLSHDSLAKTKSELIPPVEIPIKPYSFNQVFSILVVEDNPDSQFLITKYLKNSGVRVQVAQDGLEALQKVAHTHFDLIFMDVQMPIMDGIQATQLLRQKKFTAPIIALTAHAMKDDRDRCLAAGFDDYLTKPVERRLLLQKMRSHLQSQSITTHFEPAATVIDLSLHTSL